MNPDLLTTYLNRFANRLDVYDKQRLIGNGYGYIPVRQPVTTDVLQLHLAGFITIGWPCPTQDGYCKWLCFDSDVADGQLGKLQAFLQQHGWHTIHEGMRPGKDGHLWLLFDKPALASQLRILAKVMLSFAGVTVGEVFPKQDRAADIGNVVRGPLGIHLKPDANNCRGWFDGPPQDIEAQLIWLAQQPLNSAETAMQLAYKHRPIPNPRIRRNIDKSKYIDFIQYASTNDFELRGNWYAGLCPSCQPEGRGEGREHLGVHSQSGACTCWRGCKVIDIVRAIRGTRNGAA